MTVNRFSVQIVAVAGSHVGTAFVVRPDELITFGRSEEADHAFPEDGHMSALHFEIDNRGEVAVLRDRGSTNKTWLDNRPITEERLRDGDRVRAGTTTLTIEYVQEPTAAAPADPWDPSHTYVPEQLISSPPARSSRSPPARPDATDRSHPPRSGDSAELSDEAGPGAFSPPGPQPHVGVQPPKRPNNPFDSADFELIEQPAATQLPLDDKGTDPDTPLAECSDFEVPGRIAAPTVTPDGAISCSLFGRRTSQEAAIGFSVVLDTLAQSWSIQLVGHFMKIRNDPPEACGFAPLFTWLRDPSDRASSPVCAGWDKVSSDPHTLQLLPRLCRTDACLAFVGKSSAEVAKQVSRMLQLEIDGFSEAGGFLACCWPSSLTTMIAAKGPVIGHKLFGEAISGVFWCSPYDPHLILCLARSELTEELLAREFEPHASLPKS